jgi:hypothetical protein
MVRPRRAEQYLPKEDATPQRDARPQSIHNRGHPHPPTLPDPASRAPRATLWERPFARSLTKQSARKASSHAGCGKIGRSPRYTPWHRRPSYDLRRAPCDHPDFISNALRGDLFRGSLTGNFNRDREYCGILSFQLLLVRTWKRVRNRNPNPIA